MRPLVPVSTLLVGLALAGCAGPQKASVPLPKPARLLAAAADAETSTRTERRNDLDVRTETGERQPLVVAKGESETLRVPPGIRAFLAGDPEGKTGFEVDNFILLEVVQGGAVKHRFAVGYHEGLSADGQEVENVGKNGLRFEPREVEISGQLPEAGTPFTLRATALDFGNVGRVSDVFVVFGGAASENPDTWRE